MKAIAFYNTENFFDAYKDFNPTDPAFRSNGARGWNVERYQNKLKKISEVLAEIGQKETGEPPLLIGLAEIEGKRVLNDLVESKALSKFQYDFIHFESQDERGMDNAILYRKNLIQPIVTAPIRDRFFHEDGREDFTRDILYVQFEFEKTSLHTFTLHLPSRRNDNVNLAFRNEVLQNLRQQIDRIFTENPAANIVLLGDFNGNPNDADARKILQTSAEKNCKNHELYNPMLTIGYGIGTMIHEGNWMLYDQMIFSKAMLDATAKIQFQSMHIFKPEKIVDRSRKFQGVPFRTFSGTRYLGGFSDHFPIFAIINV